MKRAVVVSGLLVLASLARSAGARGDEYGSAPGPATVSGADRAASTGDDRVRRGVVLVEQHGAPIAVGTVLDRDGRVLTALSGLAGAPGADLRYADGSTVHAEVARADKASDLALLVPQSLGWTDGLDASDIEPDGAELRAMLPARGGRLGSAPAEVRGDVAAHGQRAQPTVRMLEVTVKAPPMAGAPLLDAGGRVVAVLVHACKVIPTFPAAPVLTESGEPLPLPPPPCVPEPMGAPVAAIRSFLAGSGTPAAPWLGIRGVSEERGTARGVRVVAVAPSSPAEKAGLKPNTDIIIAVNGRPLQTPEKLAELIGQHAVGETVKLLVLSESGFRDVPVSLSGAR